MSPRLLAVAAMVLAFSGCASPRLSAPVAEGSPSTSPRPSASTLTVSAWWTLARTNKFYGAIVTSDDQFESAQYQRAGWAIWAEHRPLTKKVPAPAIEAFKGLLASPVKSLDPDTRAFVAGGDGATLLPFDAVARSTNGGGWKAYVVPKTHGDQAYDEGDLVLPDGRLLVLLDAWSSDRGWTRPGPEYHGRACKA